MENSYFVISTNSFFAINWSFAVVMESKIFLFLSILFTVNSINAFVINEQDKQKIGNDLLDAFQHALDEMRKCLDQLMSKTVEQVNTQALQPVFETVGDNLNRITKAVKDLTAPTSKKY